jgi:hypothetical protein
MSSEHLTYLREVLEHDAIGFGEYDQLPAAIEHFEALEHASEQYRKVMSEQAKRIEQLEAALRKINERLNDEDSWLAQSIDAREIAEAAMKGNNGGQDRQSD